MSVPRALTSLALLTTVMLASIGQTQASPPFDQAAYAQPSRLVDIGGRRMNLYCTGSGAPTVVLDAGGGGWSLVWRYVQPAVAQTTRVCSYDRAGLGFSDPGPLPRTTDAIADDLHALLHAAGIAPPYVLVGHSMGGFDMRVFADRYRAEVGGMVLVDPAVEDLDWAPIVPLLATFDAQQVPFMRACAEKPQACSPRPDPSYDPALQQAMSRLTSLPSFWQTNASELEESLGADRGEVRSEQIRYGNLPLIVLTGGAQFKRYQRAIAASDEQVARAQKAWSDAHDRVASESSRGINRHVANAGHDIQIEQPSAVSTAILEAVTQVRL
jgi:pimeloyl-ACP methyl ester carboxylesterase